LEWERVLSFYDEPEVARDPRTLVYTQGAAPNAAQRARLNEKLGKRRVRIAVLTPSALARAAGTAVHWFRPEVRIFRPSETDAAIKHLEVTPDVAFELSSALREMKHEMGVG
jgi:hypothetical protein